MRTSLIKLCQKSSWGFRHGGAIHKPPLIAKARRSRIRKKALLCRALENNVYVAASNVAGPDQGSATCILAPDGKLVARLDYGPAGVVAAEIDLAAADARLARRWAPERNRLVP